NSRMFRPLWEHGRAIVFADGWFEWKQQNGVKQPFFIRRPLVYSPAAARKWLSENTTGKEAEDIAREGSLSAEDFTWHAVSRAVGNPGNQGRELIEPLS
ncbi:SOS response-associated peptidase family protein, partial [Cedecea sp. VD32]